MILRIGSYTSLGLMFMLLCCILIVWLKLSSYIGMLLGIVPSHLSLVPLLNPTHLYAIHIHITQHPFPVAYPFWGSSHFTFMLVMYSCFLESFSPPRFHSFRLGIYIHWSVLGLSCFSFVFLYYSISNLIFASPYPLLLALGFFYHRHKNS